MVVIDCEKIRSCSTEDILLSAISQSSGLYLEASFVCLKTAVELCMCYSFRLCKVYLKPMFGKSPVRASYLACCLVVELHTGQSTIP